MPLYIIERTFAERLDLTDDDVTLIESTIDVHENGTGTLLSTPVPNPRCLHLAHAALNLPKPPTTWKCDTEYYSWGDGCDCVCPAWEGMTIDLDADGVRVEEAPVPG